MTADLAFMAASFAVGVAEVVDGVRLLRPPGEVTTAQKYFAAFELTWTAFCTMRSRLAFNNARRYYHSR